MRPRRRSGLLVEIGSVEDGLGCTFRVYYKLRCVSGSRGLTREIDVLGLLIANQHDLDIRGVILLRRCLFPGSSIE